MDQLDIIPSFNIGFSPLRNDEIVEIDGKGKRKVEHEDEDTPHIIIRETKLGLHLRSPYVRRHMIVGRSVKPEEQRVHDLCMAAFGRPEYDPNLLYY